VVAALSWPPLPTYPFLVGFFGALVLSFVPGVVEIQGLLSASKNLAVLCQREYDETWNYFGASDKSALLGKRFPRLSTKFEEARRSVDADHRENWKGDRVGDSTRSYVKKKKQPSQ